MRSTLTATSLIFIGLCILALLTSMQTVSTTDAKIYCIVLICLTLWATAAIPAALTSLLFFSLSMLMTDLIPSEILSGFTSSAFWLVLSGSAMSYAIKESGLGDRAGAYLTNIIGHSYLRALLTFSLFSFLLALTVPSTFGRISILVPIAVGYCQAAGIKNNDNGYTGIIMLIIVSAFEIGSGVLPANLPNLIMAAGMERTAHETMGYTEYLYYFFPAAVLLRSAVLIAISYIFLSTKITQKPPPHTSKKISHHEILTGTLILLTVAFWMTDKIHGISPGWAGIIFSVSYLFTRGKNAFQSIRHIINLNLLLYISATVGVAILLSHVELPNANNLGLNFESRPIATYFTLAALSIALCFLVTSNASPAIYTPITANALQGSANLKMGILTQVPAYSTTFMPYQAPPIVYGILIADIDKKAALKYCMLTGAAGLITVIPANAAWWWLIKAFPI